MTQLVRHTTRLRQLLDQSGPVLFPDCNTALTARILALVGFQAGYAGGHSTGMLHYAIPDYGLLSTTEMAEQAAHMCAAVDIPLIFDADEFGGSVAGAYRGIRQYEDSGAAGIHMEDEQVPKHSAWRGGLVSLEEMQGRIAAAVAAKRDPDFVIFARCNELQNKAWYGDGNIEEMIRRGQAYAEAGADLFLANGANEAELKQIVREVPIPICTYNTPLADARNLGLKAVIFTGWATAAMATAHRHYAELLLANGDLPEEAYALQDKDELIGETVYSDVVREWARRSGRPVYEGLPGR